jgi:hypothetical protein
MGSSRTQSLSVVPRSGPKRPLKSSTRLRLGPQAANRCRKQPSIGQTGGGSPSPRPHDRGAASWTTSRVRQIPVILAGLVFCRSFRVPPAVSDDLAGSARCQDRRGGPIQAITQLQGSNRSRATVGGLARKPHQAGDVHMRQRREISAPANLGGAPRAPWLRITSHALAVRAGVLSGVVRQAGTP